MPVRDIARAHVDPEGFNQAVYLPWDLRILDFTLAMQDLYDLLYDINLMLLGRGLTRFDDMLRPAAMSGLLSDALTASLATHARVLVQNRHFNGHPDLVVQGRYPNDSVQAGEDGVEVKSTRGGGAVDTHGARHQWLCVFRYRVDAVTQPVVARAPTTFVEVLLAELSVDDFRSNERGPLGTRTASPNASGMAKLRGNWVYRAPARVAS